MKTRLFALLPPLLSLGCQVGDGFEPYYSGTPPAISGLDVSSSPGTVGGETVTISGSGFGSDATLLTVVFGSRNAEILSLSDSELVVTAPRGPLQGGAVDVSVGTLGGQATAEDAFLYDTSTDGFSTADELAYIVVGNNYMSCLGGLGRGDVDSFCEDFAYTGLGGIDGRAEFLKFAYPNIHGIYLPGAIGYGTTGDWSWEQWSVQTPSQDFVSIDLEDAFENERVEIDAFTIRNREWSGKDWRANLRSTATWVYQGGEQDGVRYAPVTLTGDGSMIDQGDQDDSATVTYDLERMQFCETHEYKTPRSYTYGADWPVGEYFFVGDGRDDESPAVIELEVPEVGIDGVELVLPPYAYFQNTAGAAVAGDPEFSADWGVYGLDGQCPDSDGDGVTTLADAGLSWQWKPFIDPNDPDAVGYSDDPAVKGARTYVRMTVNILALGWYGGYGQPFRASIVVPDDYNYDAETGFSSIGLPAWVMYQLPTASLEFGEQALPAGGGSVMQWGDPADPTYGYLVITLDRVTEYRVATSFDGREGDLIFAYSTGDFGFFGYDHPLDAGSCGNCIDDDGDGWADDDDPDCEDGDAEDNAAYGSTTCNDGLDNDNDDLIDADDPDCTDGLDGETNCGDGVDNDGDGLTDEEDGECADPSGIEVGDDDPTLGCGDGLDNDSDGWVDFDDPDCENAVDEELGFGSKACNDGLDNDGHGDIDAMDLYCLKQGASSKSEQPTFSTQCVDGTDNDSDGYIDANDPDCEKSPYAYEKNLFFEEGDAEVITACYNGVDDDGDGYVDAADAGCVNEAAEADGFVNDEDAAVPGSPAGCVDLVDNDADGWIDSDDPDCDIGVEEDGSNYGVYTCNDGVDNDEDLLSDAEDSDCVTGASDAEIAP